MEGFFCGSKIREENIPSNTGGRMYVAGLEKRGSDSQRKKMKTGFERSKIFSHLSEGIVSFILY